MLFIGIFLMLVLGIESQSALIQKIMKIGTNIIDTDSFHLNEYNMNNNWDYIKNKYTTK